jgi:hypothetical protein
MRGVLLWLIGIPIPVIILLYLFHAIYLISGNLMTVDLRALLFFVISVFGVTIAVAAMAQDAIVINKTRHSIVSGTVSAVSGNIVTLETAGKQIRVDVGDLRLQGAARDLLAPGTNVTVEGRFKHFGETPEMDADQILRSGSAGLTDTDATLLDRNRTNSQHYR